MGCGDDVVSSQSLRATAVKSGQRGVNLREHSSLLTFQITRCVLTHVSDREIKGVKLARLRDLPS
jgi:hypothetical protein